MSASIETKKYVCLLRHGQSLAQGTSRSERRSEKMLDCHCSRLGKNQASEIPKILKAHGGIDGVQLVITSPLTRAITTALLGFSRRPDGVPIIVHPGCKEIGSGIPENIPRTVRELKNDNYLVQLPSFEDLDYSFLPDDWAKPSSTTTMNKSYTKSDKHSRHQEFLNWVRSLKQTRIVIVTHCNFITGLLGGIQHPENALPIECILDEKGIYLASDVPGGYVPTPIKKGKAADKSRGAEDHNTNHNTKADKKDSSKNKANVVKNKGNKTKNKTKG